ncbi:ring finger protein-like [Bubalus kerabau]|uniref:ring finger protein-like n=1 Tax=Bubalus carabanensis TaxID=3119969 RepID=UPI00244EC67C|nr:ring finger protein-like [Bubalus carabanensis]
MRRVPAVCPPCADSALALRAKQERDCFACGWAWADPVGDGTLGPGASGSWQGHGDPSEVSSSGARSQKEAAVAARSVPGPAPAVEGHADLQGPSHPSATLGSPPTHPGRCPGGTAPELCPGVPAGGPADRGSGFTGRSLGPEHLDPLHQVLVEDGLGSRALGKPPGARTPDSEPLLGAPAVAPPWASRTEDEEAQQEAEECPICTEPYGPGQQRLALLNCGHGLCMGCLHRLLGAAPGDLGRVCCPLCRQKTPVLEWEICRLQEELLLADGPPRPAPPTPPLPARRGRGPWASLEHRYQLRFLPEAMGGRGCLPFLPCPPCLGAWLWALRGHGPCARRLALLSLLALELLGLLLVFTPLLLLGLLFVLLDGSRR